MVVNVSSIFGIDGAIRICARIRGREGCGSKTDMRRSRQFVHPGFTDTPPWEFRGATR